MDIKKKLITYLISFLVITAIMLGVCALKGAFGGNLNQKGLVSAFSDGFFVSGVVFLCVGALVWSSKKGVFDGMGYSFSTWKDSIFHNRRDWHKKETFYEYKERMTEKKKKRTINHFLITGSLYTAIALILLLVYLFAM